MTEARQAEFERRVAERLKEWNEHYAAEGVACASPLMDQITAEEQVMIEMKAEGLWPTRQSYAGRDGTVTDE